MIHRVRNWYAGLAGLTGLMGLGMVLAAALAASPVLSQEAAPDRIHDDVSDMELAELGFHGFGPQGGAVFVMTSSTDPVRGNEVAMFDRSPNGDLQLVGFFPTGDLANAQPQLGAGPSPTSMFLGQPVPITLDSHASVDSLIVSRNRRCLFLVNAGSGSVSAFRIRPDGLDLASVVDSRGGASAGFPVSLSESRGRLYVLNSGDSASLAGFEVLQGCSLEPDLAATRSLAGIADSVLIPRPVEVLTAPAHVLFSPAGRHLAVAIKGGDFPGVPGLLPSGRVVVYPVLQTGRLGTPVVTPFSSADGRGGPFGLFFTSPTTLVVSHSNTQTIAAYRLMADDTLELVSGPFRTGALAPCWIDRRGRYLYVVSIGDVPAVGAIPDGDGVIDGYTVTPDGAMEELGLRLFYPAPPPGQSGNHGIDLRIIGRFLYFIQPRTGRIGRYTIGLDGQLLDLAQFAGLRPSPEPFAGFNPGIEQFLERCFLQPEGDRSPECSQGSIQGIAGF